MDKLKVFSDDPATTRERLVTMTLDVPEMDVVGQAEDVPGSLVAIRQTRPDAVILDIRMPGGNGIKVLRAAEVNLTALRWIRSIEGRTNGNHWT